MATTRPEPDYEEETEQESEHEEELAASDDDDNGGSESEPEPEPETPLTYSTKPVSSSEEESDSGSEGLVMAEINSPAKSSAGSKRPATATAAEESEKPKKKSKEEEEESPTKSISEIEDSEAEEDEKSANEDLKKQFFQRLWSDEDEIALLQGMIDYAGEKNAYPVADFDLFHDFIRKSLLITVSRTQLQDKIRKMKQKYENIAKKEQKGKEGTFSRPHEQNVYELSKKIWGASKTENGSAVNSPKPSNASSKKELSKSAVKAVGAETDDENEANDNMDIDKNDEATESLSLVGGALFGKSLNELAEWIEKNKAGISEEKLSELEEKWKTLRVAEVELFLRKTALIQEQTKLVLDALK